MLPAPDQKGEDVVDADFEEVDDDKKKKSAQRDGDAQFNFGDKPQPEPQKSAKSKIMSTTGDSLDGFQSSDSVSHSRSKETAEPAWFWRALPTVNKLVAGLASGAIVVIIA